MAWTRTLNAQNFQRQINARFPRRDRASDGTIGDEEHRKRRSGHNPDDTPGSLPAWDGDPDDLQEVRSVDVDSDLGDPTCGPQDLVDHLRRLPEFGSVCRYLIFDGHWYHYRNGFVKEPFDGDPHREHIHYEGQWTQAADNNGTFDFRLDEVGDMALQDEKFRINSSTQPIFRDAKIGDERTLEEALLLSTIHAYRANVGIGTLSPRVAALETAVAKVLQNQGDDVSLDQFKAELAQSEADIVQGVLNQLGEGRTDEEVVTALRAAFGDPRAERVGRLLSVPPNPVA